MQELTLRCGLENSEVDFEKIAEYRAMETQVVNRLRIFLAEAFSNDRDLESKALLIFIVTTSIANRITQEQVHPKTVDKWSKICGDLLCKYLKL